MNMTAVTEEALQDLIALIRCPTVNPPGNEGPAAEHLADRLSEAGVEPEVLSCDGRPSVIARLKGDGSLPGGPLLLAGHTDVVPVEADHWTHPPFDGAIEDGYLYGRGAVDMKNMMAMCLTVMRQLALQKIPLGRDIIFAAVADEEAGCKFGSEFLVAEHPDKVRAECMLGEFGAFSLDINGRRFYPIQVAEKGRCRMEMVAHGDPGHGSMPHKRNAIVRLAEAITELGRNELPPHPVRTMREFIRQLGRAQGLPGSVVLPRLLNARLSPLVRRFLMEETVANNFAALLSNTVSPTILHAGEAINVIPGSASARLDGRTLPGQTAADIVGEVRGVVGSDIDIEVLEAKSGRENPPNDHPLYKILSDTLLRHDPTGTPIPFMSPGFTDASAFGKLVPYCFGFSPVRFPVEDKIAISKLPHAHDERIHVDGFKWGTEVLWDAVVAHCRA